MGLPKWPEEIFRTDAAPEPLVLGQYYGAGTVRNPIF